MTHTVPPRSLQDPFPWYDALRAQSPVTRDPRSGTWMVFGYGDVQRTLSDHRAFSSERGRPRSEDAQNALSSSIISTDPPRHRHLRSLVEQAFTPRQVRALEPRIAALVDELLSNVQGRGRMDFVHDFAYPLPVIVIAEILGIPVADRGTFKRWSDAVVTGDQSGTREMGAYFTRLIDRRRADPGDDLISGLLAAQLEGEHLDTQELLGFCMLLLVAGNETTTNLLTNTVLCWGDAPEAYARVRADRALLPGTVEEVLRYRSPVQSMFRVAAQDVELGGQLIPEGSPVLAWIGAANRDPAQFPDPATFDPARTPNRAPGVRAGRALLPRRAARPSGGGGGAGRGPRPLPDLRVLPGAVLDPVPSQIVYGVKALPVTFGCP